MTRHRVGKKGGNAGPHGVVVIDKPSGWTSHDVVAKSRGVIGTRKVGHSGTLDPDATGVLVLGVGHATRLLRFLTELPKQYEGEIVLGTETTTLDAAGEVTATHAEAIRMWHSHWIGMASPPVDRSIRLLRALRRNRVPVFALSNFGVQTFAYAETRYSFLSEFDRRYISGHMKRIKPEPEIYAMVEADSGVAPGRLLFTDDRDANIVAAAERGWQTHLFNGPAGLARRLVTAGLLTEDEAR